MSLLASRSTALLSRSLVALGLVALTVGRAPVVADPAPLRLTLTTQPSGIGISLRFPALRPGEAVDAWAQRQAAAPLPAGLSWTSLKQPGQPRLPALALLVGLPPEGEPKLTMAARRLRMLPGSYRLPPVARTVMTADGAGLTEVPAAPDPVVYGQSGLFPAQTARLDEVAWLRDHRLARVLVYPFRWRPDDGGLEQVDAVSLTVGSGVTAASPAAPGSAAETASAGVSAAPAAVTDPLAPMLRGRLVNADQALAWRGRPASQVARQAPAPGPRWKLIVDRDGWYQVSAADLAAAGIPLDGLDPRLLRLEQDGQAVALSISGEGDGKLDPQDLLGFWGQRRRGKPGVVAFDEYRFPVVLGDARYGDDNAYVLSLGLEPGLRIQDRDARPVDTGLPRLTSLPATLRQEPSNHWWSWSFTDDDTWFWDKLLFGGAGDVSSDYTLALPDVNPTGGAATVRASVLSRMKHSVTAPVRARLSAGEPTKVLDDQNWWGVKRRELTGRLPGPPPTGRPLKVTLTLPFEGGSPGVPLYLDWIEVSYDRLLKVVDGELNMIAPTAPSRLMVDGLGEGEVLALDISNPRLPLRLSGVVLSAGGQGRRAEFASAARAGAYWLGGAAAFRKPKLIGALPASDLWQPAQGAEHLIISPAAFRDGADRLAAHRRARGMSSRVVDLQEVYDQFADGLAHPAAIRAFLAQALAAWPEPRPRFALLVGDGHWNLRGSTLADYTRPDGTPEPVFMPPNLIFADPFQGEVDSANQLAAVVGDDALPDLAIGRAPVASAAEMDAFVAKTIAYESAGQRPYQAQHVFISDCSPDSAGDFVGEAERFIRDMLPAGATARRLRANDFPGACADPTEVGRKAVTDAIIEMFNNEGGLFVNYVGHGSTNLWSKVPFLTINDLPRLTNGKRLPIILSWTCLDGYWYHPNLSNMAEQLLIGADELGADVGAVAGFSPTGLGLATGHDLLWRGFYDSVYQAGTRQLGPATVDAKLALWATDTYPDLIETYTVFGDPALRLPLADAPAPTRTPTATAEPTSTAVPTLAAVRGHAYLPLLQRRY